MATKGYRIGTLAQDSETRIKHLFADVNANNFSTAENPLGTDYVVPAGYRFIITKMHVFTDQAISWIHVNSADTGVQDAAAGGTNTIRVSGIYSIDADTKPNPINCFIPVDENKYVEVYASAAIALLTLEGIEVAIP